MSFVELTRLASRKAAEELLFILEGAGLTCEVEPLEHVENGSGPLWVVRVLAEELQRAQEIVREEGLDRAPARRVIEERPLPLYWVVGLVVVNVLVWLAMEGAGGSEATPTLLRFGAAQAPRILGGEWWRTVTAVFVHIGARHLLANMVTLLVLGPAALRSWGVGRFYFMYLVSGVAGNWLSFACALGRPTIKAGASGAILGLLGVLAGTRLRQLQAPGSRYKSWHIVAMVLAFYGFVVGMGHVDHFAHVGGLCAGALLALALPPPGRLQARGDKLLALGLGSAAVLLGGLAALLAYRAAP